MANLSNINNKFLVTTAGNVGIGTTSPGYKLTVNGDVDVNNGAILAAQAYGINLGVSGYDIVMPTTTRIAIKTSGSERVSILNNGNVGIGTTSPLAQLTIGSGSLTDGNIPVQISTSGGTSQVWYGVNKNGGYGLLLGRHEGGIGGGGAGSYIRNIPEDPLYFMVSNNDLAMTILANKNVGIGTASPGYTLEIAGPSTTSFAYQRTGVSANKWGFHSDNDATYWQNLTSGNLLFTLQNGGNVGIGTTSPGQKLEVAGRIRVTTDPTIEFYESSSKRGGIQWSTANDYTNIFAVGGDIRFDIGGEKMRITSGGAVQIGTTNSGSKLNVGGTIAAATNNGASGMIVPRSYGISWGGATFTHTFDPVALFGQQFRGGQVLFECTGWQMAMNNGYIMWRNAGGSNPIGTGGSVQYVQTAYVSGGQSGSNTIAVSLNSGTNNITITFTGWHGNSHGFMCRITTNYS